ncbi:MAG: hypothetical protein WA397_15920 [Roseiarcus sp.]
MERKDLLQKISFGSQVAEDERRQLATYFVETDQWRRISNDEIDIIRGEKGAGKSAIYALLNEKEAEFFEKRILITAGENPRGETVFRDIIAEPPATEPEFVLLWKLYILALVAREPDDTASGMTKCVLSTQYLKTKISLRRRIT